MIAAVSAFSLFIAYHFLSYDRLIDAPKSKMRPYPSCVYQRLYAYLMEMIATSFSLLTAYQILSADFYLRTYLTILEF